MQTALQGREPIILQSGTRHSAGIWSVRGHTRRFFLAKVIDGGQDQSMPCAHLNGLRGATVGQNISQGQLLLDVYNCMLPVHLQRLLHHNQSDTNTTRFDTSNPDHLGPLFATNATTGLLIWDQSGTPNRKSRQDMIYLQRQKKIEEKKKAIIELEQMLIYLNNILGLFKQIK